MLCHFVGQVGGDNGLDRHRVLRHFAFFYAALGDEVQQQHADLVAAEQLELAGLCVLHSNANTVAVRVGGQQQVRLHLFAQLQALLQRFPNFRVRVGAGGEVAVRHLLLLNDGHVLDADAVEDGGDAASAGAVERGVNNAEVRAGAVDDAFLLYPLEERLGDLLRNGDDHAVRHGFVVVGVLYVGKNIQLVHLCQNAVGHLGGDLAAVAAVGLVAVVFCRVMAGGDVDTGVTLEVTHGKGQRRRRHQLRINVSLDAVGGQRRGGFLCKDVGFDPAVIGDGHGRAGTDVIQVVGKALRCLAHRINIDAVGACANHAAKTRGAEGQVLVEPVVDFFILPLDGSQLYVEVVVFQILRQPSFVFCHSYLAFLFILK